MADATKKTLTLLCAWTVILVLIGCTEKKETSSRIDRKFTGLLSVEGRPDGSYQLNWEPAEDPSSAYTVYRSTLAPVDQYAEGFQSPEAFRAELWPSRVGESISVVKTSNSHVVPANSLSLGQAYAFAVVVEASGIKIGEEKVFVIKPQSKGETTKPGESTKNDTAGTMEFLILGGNNQHTVPGLAFAQNLRVQASRGGSPLANAPVKFRMIDGPPGTMTPEVTQTNDAGIAEANYLPTAAGPLSIEAQWETARVTFKLQVSREALVPIAGDEQKAEPGDLFGSPLVVQLASSGGPVKGESISFQQLSGPQVRLASTNAITDTSGQASVKVWARSSLGTAVIKASWQNLSVLLALHVQPLPKLAIVTGNNQTAASTGNFALPLQVRAIRLGEPVKGENVTFTVLSGPAVQFSHTLALLSPDGIAQTTVSPAAGQTGPVIIRASWAGESVLFNLNVLDEQMTVMGGNLQSVAPGQAFGSPLRVLLTKNGGTVAGETVNFAVQSGASVSITTPAAVSDSSGQAQTTVTALSATGPTTIRASWRTKTVDFIVTTVPQETATLHIITGQNQTGDIGTSLSNPLVVEARDGITQNVLSQIYVRFTVTHGNGRLTGNMTSVDLLTDATGRAAINFQRGTMAGTNTVRAMVVGNPTSFVDFHATSAIDETAALDLSKSTVESSSPSLLADGATTTTLKVTTRDQYGNRIPKSSGNVVFTVSGGTLVGTPSKNNDGTWTQILRAPSSNAAGSITVSATYNGAAVGTQPLSLGLLSGQVDLSLSSVSVSTPSITANGVNTALVTVTLRDAYGNRIQQGGETVVITPSAGSMIGSSVIDHSDGTYSRYIRSSTVAQTVTIQATVGGLALSGQDTIVFAPGALDVTKTTLHVSPTTLLPDGTSTSVVTAILRDAYKNQLPSSTATVAFATTLGTWQGAALNLGDGSYSRLLGAPATPGTAKITATVDALAVPQSVYIYVSSGTAGPSTQRSLVEAITTPTIAADSVSTVIMRVTLIDPTGTRLSAGGSQVTLGTTAGTLVGTVTDHGNGTYTQILRAPAASAVATVTASFDGQSIADSEMIHFYGPVSTATTTVTAIPHAIAADGSSTSLIVVQAKDASGIVIPSGGITSLTLSTTGGTLLDTLVDQGNGSYTQSLKAPSNSGSATVSATLAGTPLASTATVTFFPATSLGEITIDCANIATYKNTNILIDAVTVTMNSHGDAAGSPCPSEFVFHSILIRNGGTITHSASTSTVEYGLELSTGSLSISDAQSSINVSGKGYVATGSSTFRVLGNVPAQNKNGTTSTHVGGTHGGEGGSNTAGDLPSRVYGSITQPFTLGGSASGSGSAGGGRVKITISGSGELLNMGQILANGANVTNNAPAGAGGSVWIRTPTLRGTGTIAASGGNSSGGTSASAGGGGGRVALSYTATFNNFALPTSLPSHILACGGTAQQTGADGAAGTIYLKNELQTYGDMIVNNCGRNTSLGANSTPINAPPPALPQEGTTSTTLYLSSGFVDNYTSPLSPYVGWSLNPDLTQNGTSILGDDTWLVISEATLSSITVSSGNLLTYQSPVAKQFRIGLVLDNLEIMGGGQISATAPLIVQNGDLRSQNTTSFVMAGALPDTLEFSSPLTIGTITLDASGTSVASTLSAVAQLPVDLTLKGGAYVHDTIATRSLTLDGATLTTGCSRTATCINLTGQLRLTNGASLVQKTTTTTQEHSLEIVAGSLLVEVGSSISAVGQGYRPATSTARSRTLNNVEQLNRTASPAANGYVGGSHGGRGAPSGTGGDGEQFETYGSLTNPSFSGASGMYGGGTTYTSLAGGGIIRITTGNGAAVIDGSLDASGAVSSGCLTTYCAGGAGGSIYLSVGNLSGNGTITANGSDADHANGRPGGGGRIAIYAASRTDGFAATTLPDRVRAFGGVGMGSDVHGGAGTIYLKTSSQTYGDLVINNGGRTHPLAATPINVPANAASTALTATQLTKASGFQDSYTTDTGHLVGFAIVPKTPQNATSTVTDDTFFRITAHTANNVTVASGDMTAVGAAGDTYQIMLVVDNLEISGKGLVDTNTKILARSGDLRSGDDTTLTLTGSTTGPGNIEILNAPHITLNGGTWAFPDGVSATSLTLNSGATLTVGCLRTQVCVHVAGALTLTGNSTLLQEATTSSKEYSIEAAVGSLSVAGGSSISAVGRGYPAATTAGMSRTFGNLERPNAGNTAKVPGGSHGGRGGGNGFTTADLYPAYDSITNPSYSGGSGGFATGSTSLAGGGIIRLTVTGAALVDGLIDASGRSNSATGIVRGGAGGTVLLTASSISGSGVIQANGSPVYDCNVSSPGGGGRVAVYYQSASGHFSRPLATTGFKALSGRCSAWTQYAGSPGTVYLKSTSQTYGDLLIDNSGDANTQGTPIVFPASGPSTTLTATTLTAPGAFGGIYGLDTSAYLGYSLSPNISQNTTDTTVDDSLFRITAQTADSLMVSGGAMTSIAASGQTYQLVLVLDNFQISGKARVESAGRIQVREGDLSSNDTVTATYSGAYASTSGSIGLLDFTSTTAVTLADGHYGLVNGITADSLTLSAATATVGCLRGTTCINLTNALTLSGGSTMTQRTTTSTTEYSIDARVGSVNLESGSTITATGTGYQPTQTLGTARTLGNTVIFPGCGIGAGGTHGGRGANACGGFPTYDSITNPAFSGASATGCQANTCTSSSSASAGGGVIRLDAGTTGTITLNGTLQVNGSSGTGSNWTTGAGGSVYIRTGTLTGSGIVMANGGTVPSWGSGGGGGRIAVYYTTATGGFAYPSGMLDRLQAFGGYTAAAPSGAGSNGTIYLKSSTQSFGDLILDNNSYTAVWPSGSAPLVGLMGQTSMALTPTTLTLTEGFLESGILTKHLVGYHLSPNTAQNATSTLIDDTLYPITDQTADTLVTPGDLTTTATAGQTFAPVLVLDNLEIRRGGRLDAQVPILVKNGDLSSDDTTTININGLVQENSGRVEWQNAALVTVTLPQGTTGSLTSLPQVSSLTVDGGGGTLSLGSVQSLGNVTLTNGTFNLGSIGSLGTITLTNGTFTAPSLAASGTISLSAGTFNIDSMTSGGNIVLSGATVTSGSSDYSPSIAAGGDITLDNGTTLHSRTTTDTTEWRLYISATNLTVSSGSTISADTDGYRGTNDNIIRTVGNLPLSGYGLVGGSHGGRGGRQDGAQTIDPYGNFRRPLTLGASGRFGWCCSSSGGGAIRIKVSGTLNNLGMITANGGSIGGGGAGAGGSVWIDAETLTGQGMIRADGGDSFNINFRAGGGGGRVAIEYGTLGGAYRRSTIGSHVTAYGGFTASDQRTGAAGTVFLKSRTQTYGDLLIRSNIEQPSSQSTGTAPLPASPTVSTVSATVLNTSSGTFGNNNGNIPNQWVGFHLNPNTNQNATLSLMDDTVFEITGNTSSSLTVATGDMTAAPVNTVGGSPFRMVLDLDNFEVAGKAIFNLSGMLIRVRSGDLSSDDDTTFVLDGVLQADTVDLGPSGVWTTTANATGTTVRCKISTVTQCP